MFSTVLSADSLCHNVWFPNLGPLHDYCVVLQLDRKNSKWDKMSFCHHDFLLNCIMCSFPASTLFRHSIAPNLVGLPAGLLWAHRKWRWVSEIGAAYYASKLKSVSIFLASSLLGPNDFERQNTVLASSSSLYSISSLFALASLSMFTISFAEKVDNELLDLVTGLLLPAFTPFPHTYLKWLWSGWCR